MYRASQAKRWTRSGVMMAMVSCILLPPPAVVVGTQSRMLKSYCLCLLADVATFLWFYHAKHFMVFNLSGEEYDYAKFDNRVSANSFSLHDWCVVDSKIISFTCRCSTLASPTTARVRWPSSSRSWRP